VDFSLYEYAAQITYVADGDTVDLTVDLGFHIKISDRFRLLHINTPERGQPGYAEPKAFIQAIMAATPRVMVRTHLDEEDRWGRMLAEIYYLVDGQYVSLNQALLDNGMAKPYL
jgi:micrococcal nuclease